MGPEKKTDGAAFERDITNLFAVETDEESEAPPEEEKEPEVEP